MFNPLRESPKRTEDGGSFGAKRFTAAKDQPESARQSSQSINKPSLSYRRSGQSGVSETEICTISIF
jgi:hypothetical protein